MLIVKNLENLDCDLDLLGQNEKIGSGESSSPKIYWQVAIGCVRELTTKIFCRQITPMASTIGCVREVTTNGTPLFLSSTHARNQWQLPIE
jgi:hypothetical protein